MRIVERYIADSIFRIFASTVLVFCFLYVLIDLAANLSEIIDRKVPLDILLRYYSAFLPVILVQTSSIACLIATLFTYSQMNGNNEIIALRASGLNFWQLTKPALCFALVISAAVFWLNERYVPTATLSSEDIRNENIILKVDSDRKKKADIKNLTFYGLQNRLYFIDSFDAENYEIQGITILGQDPDQNVSEKIVALNGKWTGLAWKFFQCQITTFEPGHFTRPREVKFYPEKLMDIKETPQDFLSQRLNVTAMNIKQLAAYIQRFAGSGAAKALNNLRVDLHQKIAFPFATFVIVLVGLPLSMMVGRRKALTFTSLGIAVLIGFLFYVANAVGLAFGKGGLFPPVVSAWLAPGVFLLAAGVLIKLKF